MVSTSWFALLTLIPSLATALPFRLPADPVQQRRGFTLPIERRRVVRSGLQTRDDGLAGTVGIGDLADLFYTVAIQVGNVQTAVNLDTGSSDLWVMSDACKTQVCRSSTAQPYKASSGNSTGAEVSLQYGDSTSGTHAKGPVVLDTVALAGLSLPNQPLGAINDTDNSAVQNGGAGIFGLGFPSQSFVQAAAVNQKFSSPATTDSFIQNIGSFGPLVSRLAQAGHIEQPIFSISLQRNTVDVGGKGQITIGELPAGIDNSTITWVPVRLYKPTDGGLNPPSFAKNEVYPLRWEVPIDGVFLDGQQLASTNLTGASPQLSALIDTGNSILRGPKDVVNNILSTVSPAFARNSASPATFPCNTPHTLAYKIGGKLFPVDPRDFVSSQSQSGAKVCTASNVVSTDAPSSGSLFSWSLGDPFLKSTTVIFYYGNLTNPSVDPPKIGFVSNVPQNADTLLEQAVSEAQASGGLFESTVEVAPTASTVVTLSAPATASPTPAPSSTPKPASTGPLVNAQASASPSPVSASSAPSPSPSDKKGNGALGGVSLPSRTLMLLLAAAPLLFTLS
ncbi:aspartic peptidase domain-containing protein [Irpex rosettiformis]|uniref:Aspartic peptidase domain-containing protein n=1 Tax=Irpex rosettiformis TaxID=378272 RepID=A0ACB8TY30_9APHY|nr:aspartic peptidase domain-containing protein [Irpex rosettiformis]